MSPPADTLETVTVEQDGRTLSGVGVSADQLAETMDRHAPVEEPAAPPPATTPAPAAPVSPEASAPKPTRGQARFSELTQKAKDAEAREAATRKEFEDYKAQQTQPPQQQQPPQTSGYIAPAATPPPTRAEPSEDEIGTKYQTYAEFSKDLAKWVMEQDAANVDQRIRQGIEADRAQQAFTTHVERTRTKGRAAYADFDAMLAKGPGTRVDMPLAAIRAIIEHPQSEHLQYAIMRDAALAQKLAGLAFQNPYAFAFELAALAPAAPAAAPASTGIVGSVPPPAPVQPVGAGSKTTTSSSADHARAGNYEAYKQARAAERGVGRRR